MVSGTTFDPDQTRPLSVLRLQAPELAGEDEIAAVPVPAGGRADEQSVEPPGEGESDEREQAPPNLPGSSSPADATTALPRLKEAMR
jgi:hypothetical protein